MPSGEVCFMLACVFQAMRDYNVTWMYELSFAIYPEFPGLALHNVIFQY